MDRRTTLSALSIEALREAIAWAWTGEIDGTGDHVLVPARLIDGEVIPRSMGEVWCLSKFHFANGQVHDGSAMLRGDSEDGPRLWSVWNGKRHVSLLFPPSPPFVLEKEGPEPFVKQFALRMNDVFPMTIEVAARFELPPRVRRVRAAVSGVIA